MKELKIIVARIRATLHHYHKYHFQNTIWYNGPGYESNHGVWKIECKNCPKIFYVDDAINKIIEAERSKDKAVN